MTIGELLDHATKKLKSKSTSAQLDAAVLLADVLKKPKAYLFANQESRIRNREAKKFFTLVKKRKAGWPVAYLTGQKEFFGLNFLVNRNVLIPRPETETLVEFVLTQISNLTSPISILDIGTGSGCIIISLAKALSYSPELEHRYFASDISKAALEVAKKNAKLHKVKITFKQGDLFKPWRGQAFDIIIANLPYLPKLTDYSTKFEPKKALIAENKGLALIEKFLQQLSHLRGAWSFDRATTRFAREARREQSKPKYIFVEFDPRQTTQIKKLAKIYVPEFETKIYKDLSGQNRFICLSKNGL